MSGVWMCDISEENCLETSAVGRCFLDFNSVLVAFNGLGGFVDGFGVLGFLRTGIYRRLVGFWMVLVSSLQAMRETGLEMFENPMTLEFSQLYTCVAMGQEKKKHGLAKSSPKTVVLKTDIFCWQSTKTAVQVSSARQGTVASLKLGSGPTAKQTWIIKRDQENENKTQTSRSDTSMTTTMTTVTKPQL